MRYHFAGVAGQICQQVKFFRREMDGAVLYKNGAGSRIDSEVARFYRLQFRGFRPHAAKIGADARQEFLDAERLGHVVIRTRRHNSSPSMLGMARSVMTRSGDQSFMISSAVSPSLATRMSYPWLEREVRSTRAIWDSSSTTRMCLCSDMPAYPGSCVTMCTSTAGASRKNWWIAER